MREDGSIVRPKGSRLAVQNITADDWDAHVHGLQVDVSLTTGDGTVRDWREGELVFNREEPDMASTTNITVE